MNQELSQAKCFIDGANVAMHPNRSEPSLINIKVVIRELKTYFDIKPISIYVIWKPSLRHYLPKEEQEEFNLLEKQGLIISNFLVLNAIVSTAGGHPSLCVIGYEEFKTG